MLKLKKSRVLLSIILAGISSHSMATCLSATEYPDVWDDARYAVHNDGTVTDGDTGLMWKVCSEGLSSSDLNDASCDTGSLGANFTWSTALAQAATVNGGGGFATHTDWRLPNVKELNTLSANNCNAPAINETIFPVTSTADYWTSSPYTFDSGNTKAWKVSGGSGSNGGVLRTQNDLSVRLVRTP